jgi:hypothetical protein
MNQAWNSEQTARIEYDWVEEEIINTSVQDINSLTTSRGSHRQLIVLDNEITPFNKRDAHLTSQE